MSWIRSSFCDASACVEVKAAGCGMGECVEVQHGDRGVQIRDSKDPGVILTFTVEEWRTFTAGVRAGEFDV